MRIAEEKFSITELKKKLNKNKTFSIFLPSEAKVLSIVYTKTTGFILTYLYDDTKEIFMLKTVFVATNGDADIIHNINMNFISTVVIEGFGVQVLHFFKLDL